ncbi:MAG: amino acid adenylation domain-containing protein [Jatrophihabitantaceae bacterium]
MSFPVTTSGSSSDRLPLSFGQEQLWFLAQLSPGDTKYNVGKAFRLAGPVDAEVLAQCLAVLVQRHEVLRATFGATDGVPYQVIGPTEDVELLRSDLTLVAANVRESAVQQALAEEAATPFDLEQGPLYRFRLYQTGENEHVFTLWFHHIITDGWSTGIFTRELSAAYQALIRSEQPQLSKLEVRYADHVTEQRTSEQAGLWDAELSFWDRQLKELPVLELPTDRIRQPVSADQGALLRASVPTPVLKGIRALGREHGVSPFMILASAVNVILSRYTGAIDIPLGIPVLGRLDPNLEDVVGLFVNMAVLRVDLSGDPTFTELMGRVAEANLDLYDNHEVPFDRVVQQVAPTRDASRNPLFQVSVQVVGGGTAGADLSLPDVRVTTVPITLSQARFDLAFNFEESADSLLLDCEYSTELFDQWRIEALVGHLFTALAAVVDEPSLRVSSIPLLTADEQAQLLAAGRGESVEYSTEPVHLQIAAVARRRPAAVAGVCKGVELTFGELDRRSDRLARYLRANGLVHEQVVAIVMDRDVDVLVAMLGVLKAGGAFAMMDPHHPAARLSYMLSDAAAQQVITRAALAASLPVPEGCHVVLIDTEWDLIEASPEPAEFSEWATRDSLAYLLYTSGSTGQPKGVLVEHRALTCFTEAYQRTFDLVPEDRMLQLAALTFDMSHGELFTGLTVGATLILVSYDEGRSPELISELMREQSATFAGFSPAMLALVDAEPYPALKYVMNGGDTLPAELVNKWNLRGRRMVNMYGPTEAVIACTEYECEHRVWRSSPPIGVIQLNRQAYVVDQHGNLAPRGIPGELLIGGPEGLARGYLNSPELTAAKFVPDPIDPDSRVYRTGDLVRWTAELTLDFLGRIDHQVKLRGLRIELGEIEAALVSHPSVRMAAVLLLTDPRDEKQLVGYYAASAGQAPSTAELSAWLREQLPDYMVPTSWVAVDGFPLTAARKIDRKALAAPTSWNEAHERVVSTPTDPTQKAVADIYAEVLGLSAVGQQDSFFELGGNSLQAMRAVSRMNRTFGIKVNIRSIYGTASVEAMAGVVAELQAKSSSART